MEKTIKWLSGKKGVIASLILTTVGFLGSKGLLSPETVVYIGSMCAIIFGTASAITKEMYRQM